MSHHFRTLLIATACTLLAGNATALTSFTLGLEASSSWDAPRFTLINTSTAGETLTDLSITIGDTSFHFDRVGAADASEAITGASLLSPDRSNNNWWQAGGRSDTLAWSFNDFQVSETLTFTVELDVDVALFGSYADARWVLFNNDFPFNDPNAVVSATFSDGSVRSITLPDAPFGSSYSYGSSGTGAGGGSAVPEPSMFLLLGVGLMGLVWFGEPRRPSAP